MSEAAIRTTGLRRVFAAGRRGGVDRVALHGLDLDIPPGEVHGLLGPNGAGKTTLCKILSTVLLPTAGRAEVAGFDVVSDVKRVRPRVGVVLGGERGLYTRLSARQNLMYWAAMYGRFGADARRQVDRLLARVGLAQRADERVETFSRGMKQRVHLARGLVGDPTVVILDEPTVGLDPVAARDFRVLITELRAERRTILMTTHDMAEAEAVCDRVSLIDGGHLLSTADPKQIGGWVTTYERVEADGVPADVAEVIATMSGVASVTRIDGDRLRVETDARGASAQVLQVLATAGATRVSTGVPNLEEVYLHVIGDRGSRI